MTNCSIEGCERRHYAKGWCQPHYNRNTKYGDPLAGKTGWGVVQKWLREIAIPYIGNDCLIFPFNRNQDGYGTVRVGSKTTRAHTVVIEATKGLRPSKAHECRHICGQGHAGCVAPQHLEWGTHAENMADTVLHGTSRNAPRYGEAHHDFRATDDIVAQILRDLACGMKQAEVATKYGFGQSHISRLKNGWRRTEL